MDVNKVIETSTTPQRGKQATTIPRAIKLVLLGLGAFLPISPVLTCEITNLAREGKAYQSSTYQNSIIGKAGPYRAIDGNTNGNARVGKSTTHTKLDYEPWWIVDLKKAAIIQKIIIHPRTDCCKHRLKNVVVMISPTPFTGGINASQNIPGVVVRTFAHINNVKHIDLPNVPGQHIRIAIKGKKQHLELAEVEVIGTYADHSDNADLAWDPSGKSMPDEEVISGGHTWKRVFADNFANYKINRGDIGYAYPKINSGPSTGVINVKGNRQNPFAKDWRFYPPWPDTRASFEGYNATNDCYDYRKGGFYDARKTVSVQDGLMNLYVHHGSADGFELTGCNDTKRIRYGAVPVPRIPRQYLASHHTFPALKSGRYVVRFRADRVPGFKTAWLLWPNHSDDLLQFGEIDFPEGDLSGEFKGYVHKINVGASEIDHQYVMAVPNRSFYYDTWHTAIIEWVAGNSVKMYVEEQDLTYEFVSESGAIDPSRVPILPMHYVLQTETSLTGELPSVHSDVGGNVQIDWVAVYCLKGRGNCH